jgi:hypothetical protein
MASYRFMRFVLTVVIAMILVACGKSASPPAAGSATPIPSPTEASATAPPSASPTPETLEGFWQGSTSNGKKFSFAVSGNEIYRMVLPASACGFGMASTLETRSSFKGDTFKVTSPGLAYLVFDKETGASKSAQDTTVVSGVFRSTTEAVGMILTKVQSQGGIIEQCRQRWTATNS